VSFSIGGVSVGHFWSRILVGLYWFWDLWASYLFGGSGGSAYLEWNLINLGGGCCADLEWKLIYVGSAEDEKYDQVLESVLVGPLNVGNYRFVFQVPRSFPIDTQIHLFPCPFFGTESFSCALRMCVAVLPNICFANWWCC
jgi:hypothetical protein